MPLKNDGKIRPDGIEKVTGSLKYLTDRRMEGMLYGRVLRSHYPHALIKSIHTKDAEELPGVKAVITAADVPGLNGFGIVTPNQPVFCEEKVRYMGDAVAAVAAVSKEAAEEALDKIIVEYEELPILDTMEKSLAKEAAELHKGEIFFIRLSRNAAVQKKLLRPAMWWWRKPMKRPGRCTLIWKQKAGWWCRKKTEALPSTWALSTA